MLHADIEHKWWKELQELSDKDDVVAFYRHYTKYLEWANIISPSRQIIYKMATRAVELLKDNDHVV